MKEKTPFSLKKIKYLLIFARENKIFRNKINKNK